jgi:translation elongation factor EF-G
MEVLGKVYGVISKRDGKVIDEDMVEGADIFNIKGIG